MSEKKLADVLGVGINRLTELASAADEQTARAAALKAALPDDIRDQITGIRDKGEGILDLRVASGAWCSKIRFREPDLIIELSQAGFSYDRIRVRVGGHRNTGGSA